MVLTTSTSEWDAKVNKNGTIQAANASPLKLFKVRVTYGAADNYVTTGNVMSLKLKGLKTYVAVLPIEASIGVHVRYVTSSERIFLRGQEPTNATAGIIVFTELASASTLTQNATVDFLVIGY